MLFTFKLFCYSRDNTLRVRLSRNRRKTEITLGVPITAGVLDEILAGNTPPGKARIASMIKGYQSKIEHIRTELILNGVGEIALDSLRNLVEQALFGSRSYEKAKEEEERQNGGNFVKHFRRVIDSKSNPGTKKLYQQTLARMLSFDPLLETRDFEDINLKWLNSFDAFLEQSGSKRNSRNVYYRNIRAVFNSAIDYEITTAYPFRRFKIRPETTRKRSLSVEQLRELFAYPVEPYAVLYRDMFKLIFMLIGINTVDLHRLKQITPEGRVEYRRAKTHRLYSVKVEPEALEIIRNYPGTKGLLSIADRWNDHRNFNHWTNVALGKIGAVERRGRGGKKFIKPAFPGLTTYWARHSWATIAASLDIPKDTISAALGHGGDTVTDIYIDFDQSKVDAANRRVLDWVLYGKR